MMKEKVYVSVVLYARNDEKNIKNFVISLDEYFNGIFENYEIIVVNDNSTDNTVKEVLSLRNAMHCNIMIVNLAWKHGTELAILAGTDIAIGDFIYEIETTELYYPLNIFYTMFIEAITKGNDIVSASGAKSSKIMSKTFYNLLNKISFLKLELETEDLRLITRRVLNKIIESGNKVRYRKILYKYSGFKSSNIKFTELHEREKIERMSFMEKLRLSFDVLILFSNIGSYVGIFFSFFFFIISAVLGFYTFYVYLFKSNIASGWTTLMIFLSIGFSGSFLILGILGKYLSIILTEIQNKRPYTVKSIERVNMA